MKVVYPMGLYLIYVNLILNIIEHRLKVKIWNSDDLIEVDNLFVANGLKDWIAIDEDA